MEYEGKVINYKPGEALDLAGKNKLLIAAGLGSSSGKAIVDFSYILDYCQKELGYRRGDVSELTYKGIWEEGEWLPKEYQTHDTEVSIEDSTRQFAENLRFYDRLFNDQTK